jgi:hypothetical protein
MSNEWGLWSKEAVEGVESWVSTDINRLRTLLLVEEDADEVLVRDDAVLSFRDGLPRLLAITVGV